MRDLRALVPNEGRIGLAVSGGPDSLALLVLAQAAAPDSIEVATVDHGLRPESAGEAAHVAEVCRDFGVMHRILPVRVGAGSLQAAAREARYAALADWAGQRELCCVATAHHADDQAETLVMRLNRGSGIAGLAAIRARVTAAQDRLVVVRPLLSWRRSELAEVVARAGIAAVADPSNEDGRFDRARLRRQLRDCDWLKVPAFAASAAHLAEASDALDWAVELALVERVRWEGGEAIMLPGLPKVLALRVMASIIRELAGREPRGGVVARAFESLSSGAPATLAGILVRPCREGWRFRPEAQRRG